MGYVKDKRKRDSLVFATVVAFCSVCTAGVSTFAWFQAQAQVSISSSTSSTTITVSNPEASFNMSVYRYDPANTGNAVPYKPAAASSATWSHFRDTGGNTLSTRTLWAGYSVTYCLVSSATGIGRTMKLGTVDHTYALDTTHERRNTTKDDDSSGNIDLCEAILIYGYAVASASNPTDSEIRAFLGKDDTDSAETMYSYTQSRDETIDAVGKTATPDGSMKLFFFLTVHFSNAKTTLYQAVTDHTGNRRVYETPNLPANKITYWKPHPGDSTSTIGYTSQVYSGLTFKLNSITIE